MKDINELCNNLNRLRYAAKMQGNKIIVETPTIEMEDQIIYFAKQNGFLSSTVIMDKNYVIIFK